MFRSSRCITFIFVIILAVFIIGTIRLFVLRFESGDVYPEYSSLRSDPLGTKILFDGMKNAGSLTVDRNYRPMHSLPAGPDTTLFLLGMRAQTFQSFNRDTFNALSRFPASGGRLVISFFPERGVSGKKDGGETGPAAKEGNVSQEDRTGTPPLSFAARWGIELNHVGISHDARSALLTSDGEAGLLPAGISWHTALTFDLHHDAWKVIYSRDKHPVLIERPIGKGSIVLCADGYPFSNEAMLKDRYPELLTWFIGKNRHMLFDEYHFGIQRSAGIVGLARKYHLHHFFAILLLLAVLFIWRNAASFVPPPDKGAGDGPQRIRSKRDHTEGLVTLLRRNIAKKDILRSCYDEWERGLVSESARLKGGLEETRKIVDEAFRGDPVMGYRAICKILSERSRS